MRISRTLVVSMLAVAAVTVGTASASSLAVDDTVQRVTVAHVSHWTVEPLTGCEGQVLIARDGEHLNASLDAVIDVGVDVPVDQPVCDVIS